MANNIAKIRLFDETDGDLRARVHNLFTYMRGLFQLIDLYTGNRFPNQDANPDRIHILPLNGNNNAAPVYTIEFELLGSINQTPRAEPRIIRMPLSGDLYVRDAEVYRTDGTFDLVTLPNIDYSAEYIDAISVLTRHLYSELSGILNFTGNPLSYAFITVVLMIAEAARNEIVRTFVVSQNLMYLDEEPLPNPVPKLTGVQYVYLRLLCDWGQRAGRTPEELEVMDKEPRLKLFGNNTELSISLARLRFVLMTRFKNFGNNGTGCNELWNFHNKFKKDDDEFDPKGSPDLNTIGQKCGAYINNHLGAYPNETQIQTPAPTNNQGGKKKGTYDEEIKKVIYMIDIRQHLLEMMLGRILETDAYKKTILDDYGIDLNDEDTKDVAKYYREETSATFADQAGKFLNNALTTNTIVRNIILQGHKYSVKTVESIVPKLVAALAKKVSGKTVSKVIGKKVPILSAGIGIFFGVKRFMKGDVAGGLGELASGAASCIPVFGAAASVGLDAALVAKDYMQYRNKMKALTSKYSDCVLSLTYLIEADNLKLKELTALSEAEAMQDFTLST